VTNTDWTYVKPKYPPKAVLVEILLTNGQIMDARWRNVYHREAWVKTNGLEFSMADPEVVGWRYKDIK
jgi:hypothetical protein